MFTLRLGGSVGEGSAMEGGGGAPEEGGLVVSRSRPTFLLLGVLSPFESSDVPFRIFLVPPWIMGRYLIVTVVLPPSP